MRGSALRENRLLHPVRLAFACALLLLLSIASPKLATAEEPENDLVLAAAPTMQNLATQSEGEPIAQGEIGTCSWVIDADGKLTVAPKNGVSGTLDFYDSASSEQYYPPWHSNSTTITSAEFEGTIALSGQTSYMFCDCYNLSNVNLSGLDTSQATSFMRMFDGCRKLTNVDMSMLDVTSIQSVKYLFAGCNGLTSVKLPDFRNARPTDISLMFWCCSALPLVDLSTVNTSEVTNASNLFYGCTSLQKVIVGDGWDLQACVDKNPNIQALFQYLFTNCEALVGANGTSYSSANVDDYTYARIDAPEAPGYFWPAESGDEEPIAQGEIGTCSWVIDADGKLTIAPLEGDSGTLDFYNDAEINPHFPPWYYSYASSITSAEFEGTITLSGKTSKMFCSCNNLVQVDLSGLDTSQATSISQMFQGCKKLTSVDMSMLDMTSIQSIGYIFDGCPSLSNVKLPDFSSAKPTEIPAMFSHCESLVAIDLSTIDTSKIRYATELFNGCTSLQKVIVGDKWDLQSSASDNPTLFNRLFLNCESLVGANGTSYAETQVDDYTYARIDTPEAPGYFWPSESGGEGDEPGGDPDPGPDPGDDPDSGTDPSDDPQEDGGKDNPSPSTPDTAKNGKPVVTLSATTFAYNGKKRTPIVTVKLKGKTLKKGRDYTVKYSKGCKAIGAYKVTVTGKKSYKFKVTKSFQIVPKTPTLKTLKAHKNSDGSSGFIATWAKSAKTGVGYQLRWSPSKKLKKSTLYTFEGSSSFAKKTTAALQVKKTAWLGKKVYVQVRAFKAVKGTNYYSSWSKAKTVKLKK